MMAMSTQEVMERCAKLQDEAVRALYQHNLAFQAFSIAIARYDWPLAEKEQQAALFHLAANMDANQAIHKLRENL